MLDMGIGDIISGKSNRLLGIGINNTLNLINIYSVFDKIQGTN